MIETDLVSFVVWSAITAVIMTVAGLSYRAYLRRKKNETPPA